MYLRPIREQGNVEVGAVERGHPLHPYIVTRLEDVAAAHTMYRKQQQQRAIS